MKHYTGIDLKRVKEAMVVPGKDATKEDIECELRLIFHEHACTSHLQFFPLLITHFFWHMCLLLEFQAQQHFF